MVPVAPVGCLAPVVVGQARPRSTGALIPILPPSSSSAFGANSLPRASSNRLPFHRSPGGKHLIVLAFTTPLAVPIRTVFDPSIGPKYPPCSKRETHGPKRRVDGCSGIHHTHSSYAVFQSRPIANQKVMIRRHFNTGGGLDRQLDRSDMPLMTFLPNFLQRGWTAGRPLQTFLALLHCQTNSTALSSARMEGLLSHRNTTLRYTKLCKSLVIVFKTFSQPGKSTPFAGITRTGLSPRCSMSTSSFWPFATKKINPLTILEFWNRPHLLCGHHHDVSLGSTSPPHTCSAPRKETGITCQHVVLNLSGSRI